MTALAVSLWLYLFGCPACERAAEQVTPDSNPTPPKAVIQPIGPPVGVRPWTPKTPPTKKRD